MSKRIVILGSTGSIGESALRVAAHLGTRIEVVGLAAGRRVDRLAEQAAQLGCRWAAVAEPCHRGELAAALPATCRAAAGMDEIAALAAGPDVDLVLCAIVGSAGLAPVLAALRAGKDVALATKEVLVMAGAVVMAEARRHNVRILPVDSEHAALFQCLEGRRAADVRRLILTASGGPFRERSEADLAAVTPAAAAAHPTWRMGRKVSIDSATLMNKGLELIEAHWLFDVPAAALDVVIHPQCIVHSLVEFTDGTMLAQLATADMRLPIQAALTYPERLPSAVEPLALEQIPALQFEAPDVARFPALRLARRALQCGGTMPAVLNAANEVAVARFCAGGISFPQIAAVVEAVMGDHEPTMQPNLDAILAADAWARRMAAPAARADP